MDGLWRKWVFRLFMIRNMFAVLITEHHLFGSVFQPYLLEGGSGAFLKLGELITRKSGSYVMLSPEEKSLVDLCDAYSESNVLRLFSREKTTFVEFSRSCEKDSRIAERFMPFVSKSNYKVALHLMQHNHIPLFLKKKNYENLYEADRVKVPSSFTKAVASFDLVREGETQVLLYSLKIFQGEGAVALKSRITGSGGVVISNEPCCALVKTEFLLFETLSYSKLKPFFLKDNVRIEGALLDKYMRTFVKNSILAGDVVASGFVIEEEVSRMSPVLRVTEDLVGKLALQLCFRYGGFLVDEAEASPRVVKEAHGAGGYKYLLLNRDLEAERRCRTHLVSLGLKPFNLFYYFKGDKEDDGDCIYGLLDFLVEHKERLSGFEIEQAHSRGVVYSLLPVKPSLQLSDSGGDWFDLNGTVQIGGFLVPFSKFRRHILNGVREYKLPDGTVALLPEEWFSRYSNLLNYAKDENDSLRIHRMYFNILDGVSPDSGKHHEIKLERQVEVPAGIRAELRSYQKVGYSWLVCLYENNFGGCLADDMGLGKTLQFLAFFEFLYHGTDGKPGTERNAVERGAEWPYDSARPSLFDMPVAPPPSSPLASPSRKPASLVVLPTSLLFSWQREAKRFAPHLKTLVYSGAKRVKSKEIGKIFDHYDLVFTTYGILRNDIEFLKNYTFECLLLDESQNIKNPDSINYKVVVALNANHCFSITGTPIENSLNDLWSQMNFINRNIFGSQKAFHNYYVQPIVKQQNEERKEKLQQLIKPFILRRTKSEVLKDLPPLIEQTIYCEMTDEHRKVYDVEKSCARNQIATSLATSDKQALLAITSLLRLRQISNHPLLVDEDYEGESTKLEEVVSRIDSLVAEKHKVLVFSTFVKHLNLVADRLSQLGIAYERLTGETANRERVIDRFQNDEGVGCFLISLKAGGVGLNLMAADYVFVLDPWWNLAAESQAINRAHRIGQEKTVMVYRFIMADTIEEKIQNLQNEKSRLADTFINSNNPFSDLSVEEFMDLFA